MSAHAQLVRRTVLAQVYHQQVHLAGCAFRRRLDEVVHQVVRHVRGTAARLAARRNLRQRAELVAPDRVVRDAGPDERAVGREEAGVLVAGTLGSAAVERVSVSRHELLNLDVVGRRQRALLRVRYRACHPEADRDDDHLAHAVSLDACPHDLGPHRGAWAGAGRAAAPGTSIFAGTNRRLLNRQPAAVFS